MVTLMYNRVFFVSFFFLYLFTLYYNVNIVVIHSHGDSKIILSPYPIQPLTTSQGLIGPCGKSIKTGNVKLFDPKPKF